MRQPSSATYGPGELVRFALEGRLRIPRFQRPFVWDDRNIVDLFDSIWKGYPLGTLLLWQQPQRAEHLRFGAIEVDAPDSEEALIVVDGQQRITTLIASLAPDPTEPIDPRFEVWFDLRTGRFAHAGRASVPDFWLPVRVALESRTLLAWLRDNADSLDEDEINRADAMAGSLRDYKIPAYVIEQSDEALLRDVFDRVNSSGRPINRAQVFHALFGGNTESASSAAVLAELRNEEFGEFDEQRIVQSLLAIRGGNVARDLHGEFASNEDTAEWFDRTAQALTRTIRFLKQLGVPHLELLPSAFPIPVLATFFHLHPEPDPRSERLLARWVWRGWALGYGRAGQTPALRSAIQALNPIRLHPDQAPNEFEAAKALLQSLPDMVPSVSLDGFNTKSAASKLAMLALAELGPRGRAGDLLDLAALFGRYGAAVVGVLAGNRGSALGARGLWNPADARLTGEESVDLLASHLVDGTAAENLRSRNTDAFVLHRGEIVQGAVESFLARKLEPGYSVAPPLEDLWVPDPA